MGSLPGSVTAVHSRVTLANSQSRVTVTVAISCADQLLPNNHPSTIHILADNLAAVSDPADAGPSPGQTLRLAIRTLLDTLATTHPDAQVVVHWVPGHFGVEGDERADELAKGAVQAVG